MKWSHRRRMRDATRLQLSHRMPVLSKIGWDAGRTVGEGVNHAD
jgi:hypothetical protein